jgi:hypothetical protein
MIEKKDLTEQTAAEQPDRVTACERRIDELTERVSKLENLLTLSSEGGLAEKVN